MAFGQPDLAKVVSEVHRCVQQINSPYNDGWTQMGYKHQLYQLKCLLDDVYPTLPDFVGEHKWEQQRLIDLLKK
jgi:hypothetical protein